MFLELLILHVIATSVSVFGGLMLWRHQTLWTRQQSDPQIEPGERRFLAGQYRRRMQSSAMIVTLGLLLHASNEHLVNWQNAPAGFFVYVCTMLGLLAWIVFLALTDFIAAQVTHQLALSRLHQHQQQLENTIAELREKKRQ